MRMKKRTIGQPTPRCLPREIGVDAAAWREYAGGQLVMDATTTEQRRKWYLAMMRKRVRPGSGSSVDFLRARTWRHQAPDLAAIIESVRFVVVGGIATRLYMPERVTEDLDILILAQDAGRVHLDLDRTGARMVGKLSIGGTSWILLDGTRLDVIESAQPWVTQALEQPNMGPDRLPVISLPYLVVMKLQSSRGVDVGDLTRMLGGADEQSLQEIRQTVATYEPDAVDDLEGFIQVGKLEYQQ